MGDDWCTEFIPDAVVVTEGSAAIGGGGCEAGELKLNPCISDTGGGGGGGRLSLMNNM